MAHRPMRFLWLATFAKPSPVVLASASIIPPLRGLCRLDPAKTDLALPSRVKSKDRLVTEYETIRRSSPGRLRSELRVELPDCARHLISARRPHSLLGDLVDQGPCTSLPPSSGELRLKAQQTPPRAHRRPDLQSVLVADVCPPLATPQWIAVSSNAERPGGGSTPLSGAAQSHLRLMPYIDSTRIASAYLVRIRGESALSASLTPAWHPAATRLVGRFPVTVSPLFADHPGPA